MKLFNLKTSLLMATLMAGGSLFAQTTDSTLTKHYVQPFSGGNAYRTWSFGLGAGVITPLTVIGGKQDFRGRSTQFGYSGFIKKQILHSFGLEADFLGGQIGGNGAPTGISAQPYASYSTQLNWSAAMQANITLANINWRHNQSAIQPYLTFGGGVMDFTPKVYSSTGARLAIASNSTTCKP
jgi:OOP family OmpA-OmpF porin